MLDWMEHYCTDILIILLPAVHPDVVPDAVPPLAQLLSMPAPDLNSPQQQRSPAEQAGASSNVTSPDAAQLQLEAMQALLLLLPLQIPQVSYMSLTHVMCPVCCCCKSSLSSCNACAASARLDAPLKPCNSSACDCLPMPADLPARACTSRLSTSWNTSKPSANCVTHTLVICSGLVLTAPVSELCVTG